METTLNIEVAEKGESTSQKGEPAGAGCCTPKGNASVCCTPSQTKDEDNGACCAQPADGSSCCDK